MNVMLTASVHTRENGTHDVDLPDMFLFGMGKSTLTGFTAEQAVDIKRALEAMYRVGHRAGYEQR